MNNGKVRGNGIIFCVFDICSLYSVSIHMISYWMFLFSYVIDWLLACFICHHGDLHFSVSKERFFWRILLYLVFTEFSDQQKDCHCFVSGTDRIPNFPFKQGVWQWTMMVLSSEQCFCPNCPESETIDDHVSRVIELSWYWFLMLWAYSLTGSLCYNYLCEM